MNDDALIVPLERRLTWLQAQIAELRGDPKRDRERRGLESQAGYLLTKLDELLARNDMQRGAHRTV